MFRKEKVSTRAFEELSAYIDGQMSQEEAHAIEAKLARSVELQQASNQIKALRSATRSLPQHKAPRNFILTRAEAAEARRSRNWSRAFGLAFSLCAVFLVVIFGYDNILRGFFGAKKEAPPQAQQPSIALYANAIEEAVPEESAVDAIEPRSVADETLEQPTLLTWGSPTGKEGMGGGAYELRESSPDDGITSQPAMAVAALGSGDSGYAYGIEPDMLNEEGLLMVYINAETGSVDLCDPVLGCGLGGDKPIQNDIPVFEESKPVETQSGVHWVDPVSLYYDPAEESYYLYDLEEIYSEEFLATEATEEPVYDNAFPLILGMDHENEGELLSASPQMEEGTFETELALDDEAYMESSPAEAYAYDSDHQNYLQDQLFFWLKIGLAGMVILFGIIWLIIRRR